MSEVIQYGNVLAEGPISATTTATLVTALAATGSIVLPSAAYGFSITNNSATATLYIAFRVPTSSIFWQAIAPGTSYESTSGLGVLDKLQLLTSAGPSAAYLAVFG
jgi:hypothetical protein